MYLSYRNPTRSLTFSTPRRIDDLISEVFNNTFYSTSRHFDLDETDEAYSLTLELPGFKQEHLDISLDKKVLNVIAKRDERSYEQSAIIPEGVDADKIDARLEDGLLTVVLPKQPVTKPRKISVK